MLLIASTQFAFRSATNALAAGQVGGRKASQSTVTRGCLPFLNSHEPNAELLNLPRNSKGCVKCYCGKLMNNTNRLAEGSQWHDIQGERKTWKVQNPLTLCLGQISNGNFQLCEPMDLTRGGTDA
ncbi:hypothetical protein ARMGADRAFT_131845 [Armillaria gallica]|uniref:Uncharacterized protein n=1 Tax=Armillaria gallica TaxID=47427 RepID=A0A2H3DZD8_ARMGA|nr:hypothetical protein ARMGADRAFT_131845 [Armillaria gallica]